jgi:hypothetical protein
MLIETDRSKACILVIDQSRSPKEAHDVAKVQSQAQPSMAKRGRGWPRHADSGNMAVIRGQGQDGRVHGRSIAPPRSAKQPHRNDDAGSSALTCNEARARQHMVATRNALLGTT